MGTNDTTYAERVADAITYRSRAARDARAHGERYAEHVEGSAIRAHDYFMGRGDTVRAELMLTRSLGEALTGNDGA